MRKALLLTFSLLLLTLIVTAQNSVIKGDIYRNLAHHDTIMVWLIKYDSASYKLHAVDSQLLTDAWQQLQAKKYRFKKLTAGSYRIKAGYHSTFVVPTTGINAAVPTYYDTTLFWNTAKVIQVNGRDSIIANFNLLNGLFQNGMGFIAGNVLQGANKGTSGGVQGIPVYLLDVNGKLLSYARTGANGNYSFANLPNGYYTIHPEQMNYTIMPINIMITTGQTSFNNIDFERSHSSKTISPKPTNITGVDKDKIQFDVYPNPAKKSIHIKWHSISQNSATVEVIDITGKEVITTKIAPNESMLLNTSMLTKGTYFISIKSQDKHNTQKLEIQ